MVLSAIASSESVSHGGASNAAQHPVPLTRPINLKVLPKDTNPIDLRDLMSRYNEELGVGCPYCHVRELPAHQIDYVSDDNPRKEVARLMIGMLRDINEKYLGRLGDRRYATPISCGNCHQGQTSPPEFNSDKQP